MRDLINKFGIPLAILVLLGAIYLTFFKSRNQPADVPYEGTADLAFFVNEATGEETVLASDQIPPVPAPDGNGVLVIAMKFKSDTETAPKTWYLVKYPEEVRDRVASLAANDLDRANLLEASRLVRAPDAGSPWLFATDPAAEKFLVIPDESPGHPRRAVFPAKPN